MLQYNEIKPGQYVVIDAEPYEVLSAHVFRKQQRKPVNAAKLRNLLTDKVIERSFHQNERLAGADIEKREAIYLYSHRGEHWFAEAEDQSQRFKIDAALIGGAVKFLKAKTNVALLLFNDKIIAVKPPIKVELKVVEAAPAVRGNTVTGASKKVQLETGAEAAVPLFVNEGDSVIINTETGEYASRGGKNS